jgi:hypothetical protein
MSSQISKKEMQNNLVDEGLSVLVLVTLFQQFFSVAVALPRAPCIYFQIVMAQLAAPAEQAA